MQTAKVDEGREKEAKAVAEEINRLARHRSARVFESEQAKAAEEAVEVEGTGELQSALAQTNDRLKHELTLLRYSS